MFIVMWNQPGCLPEMEPTAVESFGEAKVMIVEELDNRIEERENELMEDMADEDDEVPEDDALSDLNHAKQFVERQTDLPFYVEADGLAYSVTKVQGP